MTTLTAQIESPVIQSALSDRYDWTSGRVHLTGIQALARIPIEQARRDHAAGKNVGTYISGYEGSPLAGYDLELARQASLLEEHDITFEPGLNEEAAAMAVQGTQLIHELDAHVDGVVGYWYGKAPGLDRSTDALRHANLMGTHPRGGAVALVGDDPAAKSSSVPCTSDRALADLAMPTFYPADPGDILRLAPHAVALSRASGLWTALKIVTAVADGSASVDLLTDPAEPVMPAGSGRHEPTAKLLQPMLGPLERDFMTTRQRIVLDYLRLNGLNTVESSPEDRIGVVAAGKTSLDVQEALGRLGVGAGHGVRVMKLDVVWPLDPQQLREFAEGLDEIVVVEEKRSFVEAGLREALYGVACTPRISGKRDPDGSDLFAAHGELDADAVTLGLASRLQERPEHEGARAWLAQRREVIARERLQLPLIQRAPYYCSGCPHNTSTRPGTDSVVGAGIGCHAMVLLMDPEQVGDVVGLTQMGGEGTQWLGMSPFVRNPHFVQNLGDGTFHHSGSLAIRAAVASGRNITYRVLYNSTVAMTGGQGAVGQMSVAAMVRNLLSDGVARIIVTTDNVASQRKARLPRAVDVWDRSRMAEAQEVLSATPGTTVLVHDQECATELRRKRKRGLAPRPTETVFINERLCEGCGDCGAKSNCLSVHPVETEFGRKTRIHQSSCNTDLACLSGDCPAFMTVTPGTRKRRDSVDDLEPTDLPAPPVTGRRAHRVRLTGVGGTGIVTTSQVLAMAAVLAGRHVRTLDQTGLAQKGGAVVSDVTMDVEPIDAGNKIGEGQCDLYLGYDVLVAADVRNMTVLSSAATAIVSTSVVPTGAMVSDVSVTFPELEDVIAPIADRLRDGRLRTLDACHYAEVLFGAEQFANMFMLGIAYQSGALSLSDRVIEEAIRLNGVAAQANIQAFRRGRQLVAAPADLDRVLATLTAGAGEEQATASTIVGAAAGSELERVVALRRRELVAYQGERLARRYEELVEKARVAEGAAGVGGSTFSESVARYAFKLLAYKDEYEVARLALDTGVAEQLAGEFGADAKASWRLHPPTLRALGMKRKIALGAWFAPVFRVLCRLKGLRGTPFDPFGYAHVRRAERRLAEQYLATIDTCAEALRADNHEVMVEIAQLPDLVRGYEDVKLRSVAEYDARRAKLLTLAGLSTTGAGLSRLSAQGDGSGRTPGT